MNPKGELYRGEKRSPLDIELTEAQFEELSKITKEERKVQYAHLFGASKRKKDQRSERNR